MMGARPKFSSRGAMKAGPMPAARTCMPMMRRWSVPGARSSSAPMTSMAGPTMVAEKGAMKLNMDRIRDVLYFFIMGQLLGQAGSSGPSQPTC